MFTTNWITQPQHQLSNDLVMNSVPSISTLCTAVFVVLGSGLDNWGVFLIHFLILCLRCALWYYGNVAVTNGWPLMWVAVMTLASFINFCYINLYHGDILTLTCFWYTYTYFFSPLFPFFISFLGHINSQHRISSFFVTFLLGHSLVHILILKNDNFVWVNVGMPSWWHYMFANYNQTYNYSNTIIVLLRTKLWFKKLEVLYLLKTKLHNNVKLLNISQLVIVLITSSQMCP